MDHDRLFKELTTTFFAEFIELFLPHAAAELDRDSIHPIQLNILDWKKFLRTPNPVASALMVKMRIAPDRLDGLADALLDFKTISDALAWIAAT